MSYRLQCYECVPQKESNRFLKTEKWKPAFFICFVLAVGIFLLYYWLWSILFCSTKHFGVMSWKKCYTNKVYLFYWQDIIGKKQKWNRIKSGIYSAYTAEASGLKWMYLPSMLVFAQFPKWYKNLPLCWSLHTSVSVIITMIPGRKHHFFIVRAWLLVLYNYYFVHLCFV